MSFFRNTLFSVALELEGTPEIGSLTDVLVTLRDIDTK